MGGTLTLLCKSPAYAREACTPDPLLYGGDPLRWVANHNSTAFACCYRESECRANAGEWSRATLRCSTNPYVNDYHNPVKFPSTLTLMVLWWGTMQTQICRLFIIPQCPSKLATATTRCTCHPLRPPPRRRFPQQGTGTHRQTLLCSPLSPGRGSGAGCARP